MKILVAILLLVAGVSAPLGATYANPAEEYQLVGEGRLKWFFFDVYDAKLLTPSGSYQAARWPLALELTYRRDISAEAFVVATEKEWDRMGLAFEPEWLAELGEIFPDVSDGDRILLHVDKDGKCLFYFNGNYIGSVAGLDFTKVFTAIWLSDDVRYPALRDKLIGRSQ